MNCGTEHKGYDIGKKCHWIVKKDTGGAILGMPVTSRAEAVAVLSINNASGYHPEHRINEYQ